MPERTNGQEATRQGRQVTPAVEGSEAPAELSQSDQQTTQQEHDLEYYRRFLKDLISSIQDGDTAAVDRIVSLIRSGASNQDIHQAVQPVRNL